MPAIGKNRDDDFNTALSESLEGTGRIADGFGRTGKNRLAVSLSDIDRLPPEVRQQFFGAKLEKLDTSVIVRMQQSGKKDVPALAFACDLLTAAVICDIIRSEDRRAGQQPSGIWLLRKSWQRVSGSLVLTMLDGDKVKLNPEVFCVEVEAAPAVAPQVVRV